MTYDLSHGGLLSFLSQLSEKSEVNKEQTKLLEELWTTSIHHDCLEEKSWSASVVMEVTLLQRMYQRSVVSDISDERWIISRLSSHMFTKH